MAITVVGTPTIFLNPGRIDPRYPVGLWSAFIGATGDLSGGGVEIRCQFRLVADPPLPLAFSLEFANFEKTELTVENVRITIEQFSVGGFDGVGIGHRAHLEGRLVSGVVATEPWPQQTFFMGSPRRGELCQITASVATNGNGATYSLRLTGSLWLYEGMLELSGAQPVTSSIPTVSGASHPSGSLQEVRSQKALQPSPLVVAPIAVEVPPLRPGKTVTAQVIEPGKAPVAVRVKMQPVVGTSAGPAGRPLTRAQRALGQANARTLRALTSVRGTLRRDRPETVRRVGGSAAAAVGRAQAAARTARGKALRSATAFSTTARSAVFED